MTAPAGLLRATLMLLAGSAAAQAIPLLLGPLLTRTYTPADFARVAPQTAVDMLNQVPGFTVAGYREGLQRIHAAILADGRFTVASGPAGSPVDVRAASLPGSRGQTTLLSWVWHDAARLDLIASRLSTIGFACERMDSGPADFRVSNLWARRGTAR